MKEKLSVRTQLQRYIGGGRRLPHYHNCVVIIAGENCQFKIGDNLINIGDVKSFNNLV